MVVPGVGECVSTYSYDTAGRLTTAAIPGHTLTYGFPATTGCTNNAAGKDGDRTSFTDVHGLTTTSTAYCYDYADRLTATTVTGAVSGADPVGGTNLSPTYDAHGNTLTLVDETLTYDVANQHKKTTLSDGTVLTYVRDATGRVVQRTMHPPTGNDEVERYTYGPDGEYAVLDGTNGFLSRMASPAGRRRRRARPRRCRVTPTGSHSNEYHRRKPGSRIYRAQNGTVLLGHLRLACLGAAMDCGMYK